MQNHPGVTISRGKAVTDMCNSREVQGRIALIIPAYQPDQMLVRLLEGLCPRWPGPVVVVDDGSGEEAGAVFAQAEQLGVLVLHHCVNLGKGRALKTAFNACLCLPGTLIGCVTADADGQHRPEDILRCGEELRRRPDSLILGCRDFSGPDVPWKSRWGNRITCVVMRLFGGLALSDTQTGLRGIPAGFMRRLMNVSGERYEFETNMLLEARRLRLPVEEVEIRTVYLEQNRASHFRPLRDGVRIYALFLKYTASSVASSVVDLGAFSLFVALFRSALPGWYITAATVLARILSAGVNYGINSGLVFEKKMSRKSGAAYLLLCVLQMAASAGLVSLLFGLLHWPETLCKIVVDVLLFFISFQIQNRWIFR